jgi:hypothetical protein
MFNHEELLKFARLKFSSSGITRPMLDAYFSAWAYNATGANTMSELLDMTDAQEIIDWCSRRNAEPPASADNRQSNAAIDGRGFVGLMANIRQSEAAALPVRVRAPESPKNIDSAPDDMTLVDALGDKWKAVSFLRHHYTPYESWLKNSESQDYLRIFEEAVGIIATARPFFADTCQEQIAQKRR